VRVIYVVERSSGQYEDYRTQVLFYSPDKAKAEAWAKAATEHARKQDEKREKIMRRLSDLPENDTEKWHELYDKSEKVRSKYDKTLEPSSLSDANYYVLKVKEIK
jgi:hypothetical protein